MSWEENFPVYLANLSPIYIFSVLISLLAVIATVFYQNSQSSKETQEYNRSASDHGKDEDILEDQTTQPIHPLIMGEFGGIVGKIKAAKQKALLKNLQGDDYSNETDELERSTEAQQLEAIWEILKKQEDKFLVNSKQEMQEQMHLYRS